jgi:hypothetical protein
MAPSRYCPQARRSRACSKSWTQRISLFNLYFVYLTILYVDEIKLFYDLSNYKIVVVGVTVLSVIVVAGHRTPEKPSQTVHMILALPSSGIPDEHQPVQDFSLLQLLEVPEQFVKAVAHVKAWHGK